MTWCRTAPPAPSVPFVVSAPAYTNPATNPTVVFPAALPAAGISGPGSVNLPPAVNPNLRIPYSVQYNVTLEHQLHGTALRLSYVGTGTRQGEWQYNLNQPIANGQLYVNKTRAFPQYPNISYFTNGAGHQYNALTTVVKREFSRSLAYQFSWDWARDIGDPGAQRLARRRLQPLARARRVAGRAHAPASPATWPWTLPVGKGKRVPLIQQPRA